MADKNEIPKYSDIPRDVWIVAAILVLGSFMSQLDTSVVNVGLDSISNSLNSNLATTQWIASGYLLALGASIPICGWVVRKHGGRRVWLWGPAAFTLASLLCALAQTVEQLIALRILQGLAGGLLLPAGQILVARAAGPKRMGRHVHDGRGGRARPGPRPVIGGLLIEASWRWLFLMNVPVGVIAMILGLKFLEHDHGQPAPRLDVPGLLLISVGLPSVTYAITEAGRSASLTKPAVVITGVVGVVALCGFIWRELRVHAPLLNIRILNNRVFANALGSRTFAAASLFGVLILTPLYLEIQRGYTPLQTGLLMIGTGLGSAIFFPISGRLTDRYGGGPVAVCGLTACLVSLVPMVLLPANASMIIIEVVLALNGVAFTMGLMPTITAAYAAVKRD